MSSNILADLPRRHANGERLGITSVCSAHPLVIEAALRLGKDDGTAVLIEATCNQVNQEGGYTGMTPADFRSFGSRDASFAPGYLRSSTRFCGHGTSSLVC